MPAVFCPLGQNFLTPGGGFARQGLAVSAGAPTPGRVRPPKPAAGRRQERLIFHAVFGPFPAPFFGCGSVRRGFANCPCQQTSPCCHGAGQRGPPPWPWSYAQPGRRSGRTAPGGADPAGAHPSTAAGCTACATGRTLSALPLAFGAGCSTRTWSRHCTQGAYMAGAVSVPWAITSWRQNKKPVPDKLPTLGKSCRALAKRALATGYIDDMHGLAMAAPELQMGCHRVRPHSLACLAPARWADHISVLDAYFTTLHCFLQCLFHLSGPLFHYYHWFQDLKLLDLPCFRLPMV